MYVYKKEKGVEKKSSFTDASSWSPSTSTDKETTAKLEKKRMSKATADARRRQTLSVNRLAEKKDLEEKFKTKVYKTFKSIREKFIEDVVKLHGRFGEKNSIEVVENVLTYCRCLSGDEQCILIDENIFNAVMSHRFNLTAPSMLHRMFNVASKKHRPPVQMTVYNMSELILLFLTRDVKERADFAFSVYDVNNKGHLDKTDLKTVLAPMLADIKADEIDEEEDVLSYFVDLITTRIDKNTDALIDRGEFQELVQEDSMWLQFLGPCLPSTETSESFKKLMIGKSTFDIQGYFRNETKTVLQRPEVKGASTFHGLYPVRLELP